MALKARNALPWHLKLEGGTIQVADGADAVLAGEFISGDSSVFLPSAGAQRTVVGQWDVGPVVEADELELLGLAYRKAVMPFDPEINRELCHSVVEVAVTHGIVPQEDLVQEILIRIGEGENDENRKRLDALAAEIATIYDNVHALERQEPFEERAIGEMEFRKHQILMALARAVELPYIPIFVPGRERNVAVVEQGQEKIASLLQLAEDPQFNIPWLCFGDEENVPEGACLVGSHCDCYVWVMPGQSAILKEFTLVVLTLAPPEEQEISGYGPVFTPGG